MPGMATRFWISVLRRTGRRFLLRMPMVRFKSGEPQCRKLSGKIALQVVPVARHPKLELPRRQPDEHAAGDKTQRCLLMQKRLTVEEAQYFCLGLRISRSDRQETA